MIKRRFYRTEHGDKDNVSSQSSSSSSDSDVDIRSSDDSEPEPEPEPLSDDKDGVHSPLRTQLPSSSSSGYESEDSSANELDADLSGLLENDNSESGKAGEYIGRLIPRKEKEGIEVTQAKDHSVLENLPTCVLKCKSVYKCRLCPKIVCLNEESLKAHLESKRHSRSEKLLKDGRLKRILNSDGEEEVITDDEDGETHAERHARILAMAQDTSKKKGKGRQRQRLRMKRKKQKNVSNTSNSGQKKENRAKRRKKNVD